MSGLKTRFSLMMGAKSPASQPPKPEPVYTETTVILDENGNEVELEFASEGMPLEKDKFVPEVPDQGLPPRERIENLLKEMLPCRSTLLAILRFCEEPVPASQVIEMVTELQRYNRSVFGPEQLCALLRRNGGLELVTEDGEPYPEGEQEPKRVEGVAGGPKTGEMCDSAADGAPGGQNGEVCATDSAGAAESGVVLAGKSCAAGETGQVEGVEGACSDEASCVLGEFGQQGVGLDAESRTLGESGQPEAALEAAEPPVACWRTTPGGLEVVAADDPVARIHAVLEDEAIYLPIYKLVLTLCARESGAKLPALGAAVNGHPLVQKPRMFVMHFIDRLEKAGGVEWVGTWSATEAGVEVLGSLGDVEDVEYAANIDDARAPELDFSDDLKPLEG